MKNEEFCIKNEEFCIKNDEFCSTNVTTLDVSAVMNFSYISIMEEQHHGQRIWGWTLEGKTAEQTWGTMATGGSIGHKRIVDCAALETPPESGPIAGSILAVSVARGWGSSHGTVRDPPAPPPQPDDVLFTQCDRASSWVMKPDGTIRNANTT